MGSQYFNSGTDYPDFHHSKYWMSIHYDNIKDEQSKKFQSIRNRRDSTSGVFDSELTKFGLLHMSQFICNRCIQLLTYNQFVDYDIFQLQILSFFSCRGIRTTWAHTGWCHSSTFICQWYVKFCQHQFSVLQILQLKPTSEVRQCKMLLFTICNEQFV